MSSITSPFHQPGFVRFAVERVRESVGEAVTAFTERGRSGSESSDVVHGVLGDCGDGGFGVELQKISAEVSAWLDREHQRSGEDRGDIGCRRTVPLSR